MNLSESFWENKYKLNKIGWDLGEVSPPLKAYFDQLTNKDLKILIPGGGNSHEAEYLFNFPDVQLILGDFFNLNTTFDLVIEQTFFCAINISLRENYALKMKELLNKNGKLVGLMFDAVLNEKHPPFGGNKKEYTTYFESHFSMDIFTKCYNSFHNRQGMELFVKFVKE